MMCITEKSKQQSQNRLRFTVVLLLQNCEVENCEVVCWNS